MDALRPESLTFDATIVEFNEWARKYEAYHNASDFAQYHRPEQHEFLFACLDDKVAAAMRDNIGADTPILGEEGVISMLREEFDRRDPLFNRRHQFFTCNQTPGEKFSDFFTKLRLKGDTCDLANLDVDQLYVLRCLQSVTDPRLREKFLKLENPGLDEIQATYRTHERATAAIAALKQEAAAAK